MNNAPPKQDIYCWEFIFFRLSIQETKRVWGNGCYPVIRS
jgi:hypothetical protein